MSRDPNLPSNSREIAAVFDEPFSLLAALGGESDDLRPRLAEVWSGHHLCQQLCHLLQCTLQTVYVVHIIHVPTVATHVVYQSNTSLIPRPHPPKRKRVRLVTVERFLGCVDSAVLVFGEPIRSLNVT